MSDCVKLGHEVPEFEMATYQPTEGGFGKFSLAEAKKAKKWTILFFYPADFTFV
jgi:peroxiredoxin (alkyl hydroperoxide reductase subunit C)